MPDIAAVLRTALDEEPPLGFGPADVVSRARKVRGRRRGAAAVAATAAATAAAVTGLVIAGGGPGVRTSGGSAGLTLAALSQTAARTGGSHAARGASGATARNSGRAGGATATGSAGPVGVVDGIPASRLAGLVQRETGVRLKDVQVSLLRPPGELDMGAGLAVAGEPYLNVQVAPADTMITSMPTCAKLSDLASGNGDGYYGPCHIKRLADGSILVVRSGRTATGGYTMAQASLIRPDGSGVFAENTNQTWVAALKRATLKKLQDLKDGQTRHHGAKPGLPRAVRARPLIGADVLARLVQSLAARSGS